MTIHSHVSGRLGRDAEVQYLPSGTAVTKFSVAHDEYNPQAKAKDTGWINCAIFGERGTKISAYLTKGAAVTVHGRLKVRQYTRQDGGMGISVDIDVQDIDLQGSKNDSANGGAPAPAPTHAPAPAPAQAQPAAPPAGYPPPRTPPPPAGPDFDDDIPF